MRTTPRKSVKKARINSKLYLVKAIRTPYWRPGHDYIKSIIAALRKIKIREGDIVFISEKAIATAKGCIVDEEEVKAGFLAKIIARFWMRIVWGFILGPLSRLRKETIAFLREYPLDYGARHKEVALRHAGLLSALCFGSEGGIDGSNLPYAYVCLPLYDAKREVEKIRTAIKERLGVNVGVVLLDSDRCYDWKISYLSPRPALVPGIRSLGGFLIYVLSNFLKLKSYPTPIAATGIELSLRELLELSLIADKARGHGAGRNVWEMAERFGTSLTGVTWDMLEKIPHYPVVVARRVK